MCMRLFVCVAIIVAIAVGVMAVVLSPDQLMQLFRFRDFFNVTLPILAFAALIKYLCTCCHKKCCMKCDTSMRCDTTTTKVI